MLISLLSILWIVAACDKEKVVQEEDLPETARIFIRQHFPDLTITGIILDKDGKTKDYEVRFSNGTEIDFNKKGEWLSIDCRQSEVPASIIPVAILDYVRTNYPERFITKIEKQRNGYEVGIQFGEELLFSWDGTFTGFDR